MNGTLNNQGRSLFILSILCLALYALPYMICGKLIIMDEVALNYFSTQLAENGKIRYVPEGDRLFGFPGFIPSQTRYRADGEAVPLQPPGFILAVAAIKKVMPENFFLFINPLLAALCILLMYGIGNHTFKHQQSAIYAALLLSSAPVFVHWVQMFYVDIANVFAFLLCLWCMLQALERPRTIYLAGLGLSLAAAIWIRQTSVILVLPIGVYLLLNRHRITLRWFIVPALCFGLMMVLMLMYNTNIYGDPFKTGYTMGTTPGDLDSLASGLDETIHLATPSTYYLTSRLQWLIPSFSLAFTPTVLALMGIFYGLKDREKRPIALLVLATLLVFIAFFGGRVSWGVSRNELVLQSSYLRYLLPALVLLAIPTIWTLQQWKLLQARWVTLLVVLNLAVATFANFGIVHTTLSRIYMNDVAHFVLENTDKKTVVMSLRWSHLLVPDRIVRSDNPSSGEELDTIISGILEKGYSVAFIYHKSDQKLFDLLGTRSGMVELTGPEELHWLLQLLQLLPVPIPSHVYPVRLFKLGPEFSDSVIQQ